MEKKLETNILCYTGTTIMMPSFLTPNPLLPSSTECTSLLKRLLGDTVLSFCELSSKFLLKGVI